MSFRQGPQGQGTCLGNSPRDNRGLSFDNETARGHSGDGGASKDTAHQERVKVPSESGFRKQRQLYFFQSNVLSLLLAVRGLHCRAGFPLAAVRGAPLERRWAGFSLWWPLLALSEGSRVRGLQQSQLPGSGAPAQRLWGTASAAPCPAAPSPTRHRPASPGLAGGFPTTEPPGESVMSILYAQFSPFLLV